MTELVLPAHLKKVKYAYTIGQLIQWDREIQSNAHTWVYGYALRSKWREFYDKYGLRLKTAYERLEKLEQEWLVHSEGKLVFAEEKPVMQEGKKFEDFDKLYQEIMNEGVN